MGTGIRSRIVDPSRMLSRSVSRTLQHEVRPFSPVRLYDRARVNLWENRSVPSPLLSIGVPELLMAVSIGRLLKQVVTKKPPLGSFDRLNKDKLSSPNLVQALGPEMAGRLLAVNRLFYEDLYDVLRAFENLGDPLYISDLQVGVFRVACLKIVIADHLNRNGNRQLIDDGLLKEINDLKSMLSPHTYAGILALLEEKGLSVSQRSNSISRLLAEDLEQTSGHLMVYADEAEPAMLRKHIRDREFSLAEDIIVGMQNRKDTREKEKIEQEVSSLDGILGSRNLTTKSGKELKESVMKRLREVYENTCLIADDPEISFIVQDLKARIEDLTLGLAYKSSRLAAELQKILEKIELIRMIVDNRKILFGLDRISINTIVACANNSPKDAPAMFDILRSDEFRGLSVEGRTEFVEKMSYYVTSDMLASFFSEKNLRGLSVKIVRIIFGGHSPEETLGMVMTRSFMLLGPDTQERLIAKTNEFKTYLEGFRSLLVSDGFARYSNKDELISALIQEPEYLNRISGVLSRFETDQNTSFARTFFNRNGKTYIWDQKALSLFLKIGGLSSSEDRISFNIVNSAFHNCDKLLRLDQLPEGIYPEYSSGTARNLKDLYPKGVFEYAVEIFTRLHNSGKFEGIDHNASFAKLAGVNPFRLTHEELLSVVAQGDYRRYDYSSTSQPDFVSKNINPLSLAAGEMFELEAFHCFLNDPKLADVTTFYANRCYFDPVEKKTLEFDLLYSQKGVLHIVEIKRMWRNSVLLDDLLGFMEGPGRIKFLGVQGGNRFFSRKDQNDFSPIDDHFHHEKIKRLIRSGKLQFDYYVSNDTQLKDNEFLDKVSGYKALPFTIGQLLEYLRNNTYQDNGYWVNHLHDAQSTFDALTKKSPATLMIKVDIISGSETKVKMRSE